MKSKGNKGERVVFLELHLKKGGYKQKSNVRLTKNKIYLLVEDSNDDWIIIKDDDNQNLGINRNYYDFKTRSSIRKEKLEKINEI